MLHTFWLNLQCNTKPLCTKLCKLFGIFCKICIAFADQYIEVKPQAEAGKLSDEHVISVVGIAISHHYHLNGRNRHFHFPYACLLSYGHMSQVLKLDVSAQN